MRKRYRGLKDELVRRATEAFTAAVQASMNPDKAASDAEKIRSKYHGLPIDVIAELLVRRAARKTKWEGAANGFAVAAASGAASVRVWHITSRGWDPWTERPLPEVVRVAYPL
jgi:hypothetical protein